MSLRLLSCCLITVFLAAPPARAASPEKLAGEVMALCGINRSLAEVDRQVAQQAEQLPPALPAQARAALLGALRQAFTARAILASVKPRIAALDAGELSLIRDWCASPLGRRITAEELRASGPEADAALAAYVESLKAKPPAAARLELIERIEKASAAVPVATAMLEGIATGVAHGANTALPAERRQAPAAIDGQLAEAGARLREGVAEFMRVVMLFSYDRITDAELAQYVRLLESPAGRAFSAAYSAGIIHGMSEAARRVGAEMVRRLEPGRPSI